MMEIGYYIFLICVFDSANYVYSGIVLESILFYSYFFYLFDVFTVFNWFLNKLDSNTKEVLFFFTTISLNLLRVIISLCS